MEINVRLNDPTMVPREEKKRKEEKKKKKKVKKINKKKRKKDIKMCQRGTSQKDQNNNIGGQRIGFITYIII